MLYVYTTFQTFSYFLPFLYRSLYFSIVESCFIGFSSSFLFFPIHNRYTVFDSKQMPQIAQTPSQAPPPPLLMMMSPTAPSISNNAVPSNSNALMHNPLSISQPLPHQIPMMPQAEILSVSSKKLCSYCNHELGSGAAMIIENLGLFYHIDCFKCSVCQTPIADGNINGTDVRVRNSRLHCANCFSNEEGIKFSCV